MEIGLNTRKTSQICYQKYSNRFVDERAGRPLALKMHKENEKKVISQLNIGTHKSLESINFQVMLVCVLCKLRKHIYTLQSFVFRIQMVLHTGTNIGELKSLKPH